MLDYRVIDTDKVIAHLNASQELELSLDDAFAAAIVITLDEQARARLKSYRKETSCHWNLATSLIARYGAVPVAKDTTASLVEDLEMALTKRQRRLEELGRLQALSTLVPLARSNWEVLRQVALALKDASMVDEAFEVVEQKSEQIRWLWGRTMLVGRQVLVARRVAWRHLPNTG